MLAKQQHHQQVFKIPFFLTQRVLDSLAQTSLSTEGQQNACAFCRLHCKANYHEYRVSVWFS